MGALKTLFRGTTIFTLARWMLHKRIHTKLDGAHPTGALASPEDRRDRRLLRLLRRHRHDRRPLGHARARGRGSAAACGPNGKPYGPWHDATTALEGPVAAALGELARDRWRARAASELAPVQAASRLLAGRAAGQFADVESPSPAPGPNMPDLRRGARDRALYLDQIARARRFIYAESQYFASRRIAEAIARRLAEPDGPEIVIVNPSSADGWLEQVAMDTARARLYRGAAPARPPWPLPHLPSPITAGGAPIYVHAKILIVDDAILRVGSSNINNRSLGLDTECDVTIDARRPPTPTPRPAISALRDGLIAEHLGVDAGRGRPAYRRNRLADRGDRGAARPRPVAAPLRSAGPRARWRNGSPTMRCSTRKSPTRCSRRFASARPVPAVSKGAKLNVPGHRHGGMEHPGKDAEAFGPGDFVARPLRYPVPRGRNQFVVPSAAPPCDLGALGGKRSGRISASP